MPDRLYEVWSTYKVTGVAYIEAASAKEAKQKGLDAHELGIVFDFGEAHGETVMHARLVKTDA